MSTTNSAYQNSHQEVIGFVARNLASGCALWFCTVLSTWGSSPRPVGSLFAFNARGEKAGSLSGGCVEEDLVDKTLADFAQRDQRSLARKCEVIVFGATAEEAGRLRLPCGGLLRVAVERLPAGLAETPDSSPDNPSPQFEAIASALEAQSPITRKVSIKPYRSRLLAAGELDTSSSPELAGKAIVESENQFFHFLGPSYTLLLIGISEVSRAVARMAQLLDYRVIVCEPREEVLKEWDVAGTHVIHGMPDDIIRSQPRLDHTAILALTHDPRIDDMGLMEALTTDAFYIGAMGSARSSASRRERLMALDVSPRQLDLLHAPIGLDIGSKTPAEIALAILAEITRERSLRQPNA